MRIDCFWKAAIVCAAISAPTIARAGVVTVNATDSIFVGANGELPTTGQNDPPLLPYAVTAPVEIAVAAGDVVTISATGQVAPGIGAQTNGPAGAAGATNLTAFGIIGGIDYSTHFFLAGAFIGTGTGSGEYSPFYIGDGGTFIAPSGSTELLLGLPDGYAFVGAPSYYGDNSGSFTVTYDVTVPEPDMDIAMFGLTAAVLGLGRTRARRRECVALQA
nr:hypothetical protein [uncultured Rhodopila sp.]